MHPTRWEQIQRLFNAAADMEPAEREPFLSRECGSDGALRQQIETLLACEPNRQSVPAPAADPVPERHLAIEPSGDSAARELSLVQDEEVADGPAIGNYTLVREIGEGGMGVVYEAEQYTPRRRVALKLIRSAGYSSERHRRLFQREVEALERLDHPAIVPIYESGVTQDGQPFLSMELVGGESLEAWLAREPAPPELRKAAVRDRLKLFLSICDGVAYAHRNGVIHLDLKPSNILIQDAPATAVSPRDRPSALVKILDFGTARFTGALPSWTATESGLVQGSLRYSSPEQVRGDGSEADVRSDIYSLGVILYELLTGQHPYLEPNIGLAEILQAVCFQEPARFATVARRFDSDLEAIVLKALEKDPERRYQSVAALAADLEHYLANEPIAAHPWSTSYQIRKLVQRNRAASVSIILLGLLLIAASIAAWLQWHTGLAQRDHAEQDAAMAKEVSGFMLDLFRQGGGSDHATPRDLLRQGEERARREFAGQPELLARLLDHIGAAYNVVGPFSEAQKIFEESIRIREQAFGKEALGLADSYSGLGETYFNLGEMRKSANARRRGLEIRTQHLGPADEKVLADKAGLALSLSAAGDHDEAEWLIRSVVEADRRRNDQSMAAASHLQTMGKILRGKGDFIGAIPALRESLARQKQLTTEAALASPLSDLGFALNDAGEYASAERVLRHCARIMAEVSGPDQANLAVLDAAIGFSLNGLHRYEEAEAELRTALAAAETSMGLEDPRVAGIWLSLGEALTGQGKLTEAADTIGRGVDLTGRKYGEDDPHIAAASVVAAEFQIAAGHPDIALSLADSAVAAYRRTGKTASMDFGLAERTRGKALLALDRHTQAWAALTEAKTLLDARLGPRHPETVLAASLLGRASADR